MKKKLHQLKYYAKQGKKTTLLVFAVLLFCCSSIKGISQQLGQWTFINGSTTPGAAPNYGTLGVAAGTNTPGGRRGAAKFIDKNGNLFLYGGSPTDYGNFFGDLWKWDGTNWTWVNGSASPDQPAVYGTKGVAAGTNTPGSRNGAMGWSDKNGNFWLFGGFISSSSITSMLNDLWKWDGTNWTWVSGSNLSGDQGNLGNYGTKGVAASTNQPPPRYYGSTWVDASGNVWLFGGASAAVQNCYNDLWKWDGTNWTWISGTNQIEDAGVYGTKGVAASGNQPRARFQASNWTDKNGNLWLFGGGNLNGAFNDLWKWDGTNWTWANGNPGTGAFASYGALGVADPTSVPGSRMGSGAWTDKSSNFWLFGGSDGDGIYNEMWKWDGTNWAWMGGTSSPSTYGTRGVPGATNTPGSREADMGWTDKNGNFVIYGGWSYVDGYPPFLNDLWSFTPPTTTVLPLTLTNFTAAKQGNSALLDWNVAMEQSIDRYWIERSSDGITYNTIDSLASNGNSSISTNYSFIDSHPLEGAAYYRLRITEKDGKTSYSSIRLLNFGNAIKVAIYPNPVKTSVTITGLATGMTISILNVIGQPVLSQKATNSTLEIKTGTIPAGIYGIRIVDTNGQIIFGGKLVKE